MENLTNKTIENINNLKGYVGEDLIASVAFLTCCLKKYNYLPEVEDIENNWRNGELNFAISAIENFFSSAKKSFDSNYIFESAISNACQTFIFFINSQNSERILSLISKLINELSDLDVQTIINTYISKNDLFHSNTSASIIELSKRILNINNSDIVADLCCGQGCFLSKIDNAQKIIGYDINMDAITNAYMSCLASNKNFELVHQDVLTCEQEKYDKIFMEYPWGLIYQRPLESIGCNDWKPLPVKDLKRSMTSWLFIARTVMMLKENGLAVIHVNNGSLFSKYESDIRKKAIELGLVKAVIALPKKINSYTGLQSSLLVLSFGNDNVRFVDATEIGTIDKRTKNITFDRNDIETITQLYLGNGSSAKAVTIESSKILEQDGDLYINRYFGKHSMNVAIPNGKKVNDVTNTFIRSVIANSCFLEKINKTNIKVLSSADIQDGNIDIDKLPYLSVEGMQYLTGKWYDNILQDGDVVMTNKSTTIKSAVINTNGEKIILFGSLVGMRVNKNLIDPVYLSSFINSNAGQSLVSAIQTGSTIKMITLNNLKELTIPCPSLNEQTKLVSDLEITIQMIKDAKERILTLKQQYESTFDDLFVGE